jgi:hypothetical protein
MVLGYFNQSSRRATVKDKGGKDAFSDYLEYDLTVVHSGVSL